MTIRVFEVNTEQHLELALHCHHDWYVQAGYIEAHPRSRFMDEWSAHSKYFLVTETGRGDDLTKKDVIGMVRLVHSAPFPIHRHFELWPRKCADIQSIAQENQCEVSALCWAPKCRTKVIPYLFRSIRQCTKAMNKSAIWACLDKNLIPILEQYSLPFRVCGETRFYMGSDTIPLFMRLSEMADILSTKHPDLYQFVEKELDTAP